MKYHFLLICLAFLPMAKAQCQPAGQALEERIQQIENRLTPSIIIAGQEEDDHLNIHDRMKHHKVPGLSIAFVNDGKIEWARGYGYLSSDSLAPVDSLTLFQAASISKPVAALAALRLVQEGQLQLDQDVNTYLKGWQVEASPFTEGHPITLEHLLTHTAGLTVHGFGGYAQGDSVPTLIQVLNGEKPANSDKIVPDTFPGSIWRYSGGGYTVMQKIVEDATGESFPTVMQKRVLAPIGMEHSTYQQPLPARYHAHASIGHRPDGEKVEGNWHTYPEMAAAGLWTTPSDLARYIIEVQRSLKGESNKVLSREMTEQMLTSHLGDWGLGPSLAGAADSLRFSHGGSNEGYKCQMMGFAYLGQGVVLMSNSDNGIALIGEVMRAISDVYGWGLYTPTKKEVVKLEPEQLERFVGKYRLDEEVSLNVSVQNGQLWVKQLWDGAEYELYPESELSFFETEEGIVFQFNPNEESDIVGFSVFGGAYQFEKIDD
ncbi:MAG: serine hydrolase [Lewinellaceae bacterium]|nr:serine hydrolase [Phaeodactylibacter sp.]MCB0613869.1 serine hydrolase [Phaeodactylibacter sp.]MCB9346065.1 serine hydrolase [Lewinellaceae bacterium]